MKKNRNDSSAVEVMKQQVQYFRCVFKSPSSLPRIWEATSKDDESLRITRVTDIQEQTNGAVVEIVYQRRQKVEGRWKTDDGTGLTDITVSCLHKAKDRQQRVNGVCSTLPFMCRNPLFMPPPCWSRLLGSAPDFHWRLCLCYLMLFQRSINVRSAARTKGQPGIDQNELFKEEEGGGGDENQDL